MAEMKLGAYESIPIALISDLQCEHSSFDLQNKSAHNQEEV